METKTCIKCNIDKSFDEFCKSKANKNGCGNICKLCKKEYDKKYKANKKQKKEKIISKDKVCSKCKIEKDKSNFRLRMSGSGKLILDSRCNSCLKEYSKQYFNNNRDRINKRGREYNKKNRDKIRVKTKANYYKRKDRKNELVRIKRKSNPVFRMKLNMKSLVYRAVKGMGFKKKSRTVETLGCSFEYLKEHLEKQFQSWMNWENYGSVNGEQPTDTNQCWDIDHIIPVSIAMTEEEILKLNHYTNLQPLCSYFNRHIKRNNVTIK